MELLVVVAVIGVLATVILASVNSAREKAQYAAALSEVKQFEKIVVIAQLNTGLYLGNITGNFGLKVLVMD